VQALLRELLAEHRGSTFETQAAVVKALGRRVADAGIATSARKAVWSGLAVRDDQAPVIIDRKGNPEPDADLRDQENVPLPRVAVMFEDDPTDRFASLEYRSAVDDYMRDEVLPYVPDAWVDPDKTKIGYEIPLTRHFYKYVPPRPLEEIDAEFKLLGEEIQELLAEIAG
jgi:type I restriction enzyme M protein